MTPEITGLLSVVKASDLVYKVTSTQRAPRFVGDTSYHIAGSAVDLAGPTPWNIQKPSPYMLPIWELYMQHAGKLAELFYSGAPFFVKNGVVRPISQLSASIRAAHWNHVHVAVKSGTILQPKEVVVPDVPAAPPVYKINPGPNGNLVAGISAIFDSTGKCTGYLILGADGGVFGFGPGSAYFGRVTG